MKEKAILITQCLQKDFVQPLERFDPLPNRLHVGYDEALRLMGEQPEEGPVSLAMQWAYDQPADNLCIIHIRDWHDPADPFQKEHFLQFGGHCIKNTKGAEFAFPKEDPDRPVHIIDSPGLNDFIGTNLENVLSPFVNQPARVGLMGVWTEAKISFLAYDLRTRYPNLDLAVCSALTASSSRSRHFQALDQLQRLLGVKVFPSIGEFTNFLGGSEARIPLPVPRHSEIPKIIYKTGDSLSPVDADLVRFLFRECNEVKLRILDGGFSGNLVLGTESIDLDGHQQVAHVVKIGPQSEIGKERAAFERIEEVLGNNAPNITSFADLEGRGALKYRYAAMGGGFSRSFQDCYMSGMPLQEIKSILSDVFQEQLGRFFRAATLERCNLLEYYWFNPKYAEPVRQKIEKLTGSPAKEETLRLPLPSLPDEVAAFPNPYFFYKRELGLIFPQADGSSFFSFVHGDLNGANIIVDAHNNVWLIDFFHTHRGHILRDLIKLENDLLYIFTPVNNEAELLEALSLSKLLLGIEDLAQPLPPVEETSLALPAMRRAYETLRFLRSFYPRLVKHDRDPLQVFIGQLRYAAHTLSFDESNYYQRLWALATAGWLGKEISSRLKRRSPLRIDWLDEKLTGKGKLGITIMPGRKDYNRRLSQDLAVLKKEKVTHVVALITDDELRQYGVTNLLKEYEKEGFTVYRLAILDQGVSSQAEMKDLVTWLDRQLEEGSRVMIHCVGGLGRSGLAAASYLKWKGMDTASALAEVRRARSIRAIESKIQESFVKDFLEKEE